MTIEEKNKLESDIAELKNCLVIYKNGKPKVVSTLQIPITYNCQTKQLGEVLNLLENRIKNQDGIIKIQNQQINKLREINLKLVEAIKKNNVVNNINNANIIEAIKDLGGNI